MGELSSAPRLTRDGAEFAVWAPDAERLWVCRFDDADRETRTELSRDGALFRGVVPGLAAGGRYGLRADGEYAPERGLWFDPARLLVDPYAVELDGPFEFDPRLASARGAVEDTAPLMPKAVLADLPPPSAPPPPLFRPGGLIYEVNVRGFTLLHPDLPPAKRGTVGALAQPAVIAHLTKLGVSAVELMPIVAWIDERHLPPLGLRNAWGYNPVVPMALDPRLCPGGIAELRETVAALRAAGIGTILDLVFNHTGESDIYGPTLSLRGLDARGYYAHAADGALVNDTGCGNMLDCSHPVVRRLVLDSLRHFAGRAGVDGFRFDLATVLGRGPDGFDAHAALLEEIAADPLLGERVLIAEPWDVGSGGYQLGRFGARWLEWNDRYRDDVRRFWRGDVGAGVLAARLAGSFDLFDPAAPTRTVNFVAAHDGFAVADVVAYAERHNAANGEQNRDGHGLNYSWNNGVEGAASDPAIGAARDRDGRALLATLFASRGTILLTAGDEFGRSQGGNNNAYAQDNRVTWLDWKHRDRELEAFVAELSTRRRGSPLEGLGDLGREDVRWLRPDGSAMDDGDWAAARAFALAVGGAMVLVNGTAEAVMFRLDGTETMVGARAVEIVSLLQPSPASRERDSSA